MTETTHAATGVRDVVIVGGGPAAHRLADSLHARDTDRTLRVTVVGEELHRPYDRVALSTRLADAATDLTLEPTSMWDDGHIRLVTGERVIAVDDAARTATTSGGLVLALGRARPRHRLERAGARASRAPSTPACTARSTTSTPWSPRRATLAARHGRPAQVVVAGGGLLGLEAAGGLAKLGAHTAVVHSGGWLMSAQLDEGAGRALGRIIAGQGIGLHLGTRPAAVARRGRRRRRASSSRTAAASTPTSSSSRSASAPATSSRATLGLELGPRGGVAISTACAASAANVWAIGEVASFEGRCTGLVAPANAMAEVVADRLLGGRRGVHERRRRDEAEALGRRRRELRRRARAHRAGARDRLRRPGARPVPEARHDRRREDAARRHLRGRRLAVRVAAPAARHAAVERAGRLPLGVGHGGAGAATSCPPPRSSAPATTSAAGTIRDAVERRRRTPRAAPSSAR